MKPPLRTEPACMGTVVDAPDSTFSNSSTSECSSSDMVLSYSGWASGGRAGRKDLLLVAAVPSRRHSILQLAKNGRLWPSRRRYQTPERQKLSGGWSCGVPGTSAGEVAVSPMRWSLALGLAGAGRRGVSRCGSRGAFVQSATVWTAWHPTACAVPFSHRCSRSFQASAVTTSSGSFTQRPNANAKSGKSGGVGKKGTSHTGTGGGIRGFVEINKRIITSADGTSAPASRHRCFRDSFPDAGRYSFIPSLICHNSALTVSRTRIPCRNFIVFFSSRRAAVRGRH